MIAHPPVFKIFDLAQIMVGLSRHYRTHLLVFLIGYSAPLQRATSCRKRGRPAMAISRLNLEH